MIRSIVSATLLGVLCGMGVSASLSADQQLGITLSSTTLNGSPVTVNVSGLPAGTTSMNVVLCVVGSPNVAWNSGQIPVSGTSAAVSISVSTANVSAGPYELTVYANPKDTPAPRVPVTVTSAPAPTPTPTPTPTPIPIPTPTPTPTPTPVPMVDLSPVVQRLDTIQITVDQIRSLLTQPPPAPPPVTVPCTVISVNGTSWTCRGKVADFPVTINQVLVVIKK